MKRTLISTIIIVTVWVTACLFLFGFPVSAIQIYVAQGDAANVPVEEPGGTCWVLPETGPADHALFDFQPIIVGKYWTCQIPANYTANMHDGTYTVLYQNPAVINGKSFKDISYKDGFLVSSLVNSEQYDTSGKDSSAILQKLTDMINSTQLNTVVINQVVIETPLLTVDSFGPITREELSLLKSESTANSIIVPLVIESPYYRISGQTNLPNGTTITVSIDEVRFYAQHNSNYTYTTKIIRSDYAPENRWTINIPLNMNNLPPGWHDVSVYGGEMLTTRRFKTDQQVVPFPTPTQYVNYLSNGDIAPVYINTTVTVVQVKYEDRWHTATPTPTLTDALGSKVNYPYDPGETIPSWVGVVCVILVAVLVIAPERKLK